MSRGMAIVTFESAEHAVMAKTKYHGKVVDGSAYILLSYLMEFC